MEAITKQTGSTTLSCEHSFHFRCIVNWFDKQIIDSLKATCPCCRGAGGEMDRFEIMEELEEDEDEDDDDESYDEESETASEASYGLPGVDMDLQWIRLESGRWLVVSTEEQAYENLRGLFGPLNQLDEEDVRVKAAEKIQAIVRGYQARSIYGAAVAMVRMLH
jgi:hypothetical protein